MFKFNDNNLITGYIKQLLHTFNLPSYTVWKPGNYTFADKVYLYNNMLIKLKSKEGKVVESFSRDEFKVIKSNYILGEALFNGSKNLKLNSNTYDAYTHEYLGNYLRFIRDYKGVDLMSMYNCYTPEIPNNLAVAFEIGEADNKRTIKVNSTNANYKIFMIPVKFQQKYTFAIDCDNAIEIFAGLYSDNSMVDMPEDKNVLSNLYRRTYYKRGSSKFKHPFVYDKLFDNETLSSVGAKLHPQENNLKLFIKVPNSCNSSIVVLEGDYVQNTFCNYDSNGQFKVATKMYAPGDGEDIEYDYITRLQLLLISSGVMHPFADRLVEYLFDNVITPNDRISNNIAKVQEKLIDINLKGGVGLNHVQYGSGIWDDNLRQLIYQNIKNSPTRTLDTEFDILGYVDKTATKILGGIE